MPAVTLETERPLRRHQVVASPQLVEILALPLASSSSSGGSAKGCCARRDALRCTSSFKSTGGGGGRGARSQRRSAAAFATADIRRALAQLEQEQRPLTGANGGDQWRHSLAVAHGEQQQQQQAPPPALVVGRRAEKAFRFLRSHSTQGRVCAVAAFVAATAAEAPKSASSSVINQSAHKAQFNIATARGEQSEISNTGQQHWRRRRRRQHSNNGDNLEPGSKPLRAARTKRGASTPSRAVASRSRVAQEAAHAKNSQRHRQETTTAISVPQGPELQPATTNSSNCQQQAMSTQSFVPPSGESAAEFAAAPTAVSHTADFQPRPIGLGCFATPVQKQQQQQQLVEMSASPDGADQERGGGFQERAQRHPTASYSTGGANGSQQSVSAAGGGGKTMLGKLVGKKASRLRELVLQNLGRADRTQDELFDLYEVNFYKQQQQMARLGKEFKLYSSALRAYHEASRSLNRCIQAATSDYQSARHDLVCENLAHLEQLNEDLAEKLHEQVARSVAEHLGKFEATRDKIGKRHRKLIDYDSSRRLYELMLASVHKKRTRGSQQQQQQDVGASLQNQQPQQNYHQSILRGLKFLSQQQQQQAQEPMGSLNQQQQQLQESVASQLVDEARLLKLREQFNYCKLMYESINSELHEELPVVYEKKMRGLLQALQNYYALEAHHRVNAGKLLSAVSEVIEECPQSMAAGLLGGLATKRHQDDGSSSSSGDEDEDEGGDMEEEDEAASSDKADHHHQHITGGGGGSSGVGSSRGDSVVDSSASSSGSPELDASESGSGSGADHHAHSEESGKAQEPAEVEAAAVATIGEPAPAQSAGESSDGVPAVAATASEQESARERATSPQQQQLCDHVPKADVQQQQQPQKEQQPPEAVDGSAQTLLEACPEDEKQEQQQQQQQPEDISDSERIQIKILDTTKPSSVKCETRQNPVPDSEKLATPSQTAADEQQRTCLYKVKTNYKYLAEDVDELCFEPDEIIQVIEFDENHEPEDGWLLGVREVNNQRGLFPANFTQPL